MNTQDPQQKAYNSGHHVATKVLDFVSEVKSRVAQRTPTQFMRGFINGLRRK